MQINITREQLAAKREELEHNGIAITGDNGEVNSHGCVIDYNYDGKVLELTVKKKPFYVSMSTVESKLKDFFV